MQKIEKIENIKYIIKRYGSFSTSEIEADSSPSIIIIWDISILVERFEENNVEAYAYINWNEIWSTTIDYKDLSDDNIDYIYDMAIYYKELKNEE